MTYEMRNEIAKELFLYSVKPNFTQEQVERHIDGCIAIANMFMTKLDAQTVKSESKLKGCPKCFGSGGKIASPCKNCEGTGKVPK